MKRSIQALSAAGVALAIGLGTAVAAPAELKTYPSTAVEGLPYSGAVRAGDVVYVGGVLGTAEGGQDLVPGGITPEARQAFGHMKNMLEAAGTSLDRTFKCIVLLSDIDDFPEMNAVFTEFFPESPPTRSTIIVPEIPKNAAIEVDCNALAGD